VLNLVLRVIGASPYFFYNAISVAFFWFTLYSHAHRKGGPLAVTDANLLLGRLIPDYFPKIFGKSEKEPLDVQASRTGFEKLMKEINESDAGEAIGLDEVVYGLVLSFFFCGSGIDS
jgi:hypothetical protein